jgi:hypothetical protein
LVTPGARCDVDADQPRSQEVNAIVADTSSPFSGRTVRGLMLTSLAGGVVAISVLAAPVAGADDPTAGAALNGRFVVTSDGDRAKTNEIFHNEQTVRQVWTITSSCDDPTSCSGKVTSNQGWSADLRFAPSWWAVDRVLNNWQPCRDGTAARGFQKYRFYGVDSDGQLVESNATVLAGSDTTFGTSGDCGINRQLMISLPLRLQKLD